jgi:cytidine deaminase
MKHFDNTNPKPELVIALTGPVGTDLDLVAEKITEIMRTYRYETVPVKVSSLIKAWCDAEASDEISKAKGDQRINLLMDAGDLIRQTAASGSALIPLVLTNIREQREGKLSSFGYEEDKGKLELYNHCFLINSLKHPDEVSLLRRVYREKLIVVSAFSGVERRTDRICEIIAKSEGSTENKQFEGRARDLIEKDAKRSDIDIGQNLSSTFHLADFFIRVSAEMQGKLDRAFEIFFGNSYITPLRDEFFMFEAKANSLRSADLSRQVGAVITNENHDIVSRGCNEVPMASGGSYWPDKPDKFDNRDFKKGRDFNSVKKDQILKELIDFLTKEEILKFVQDPADLDSIVNDLVFGQHKKKFSALRISNLIEFGRMVHAEMSALMEAARRGLPVQNGILYCTTFPCHMCARHIISAGIKRVVYIEPYPKSMTKELFPDTVAIDSENTPDPDQRGMYFELVSFEPFEGVAPRVYSSLFAAGRRKDGAGYTVSWNKVSAQPKLAVLSTSHLPLELSVAKQVESLTIVAHNALMGIEGGQHAG